MITFPFSRVFNYNNIPRHLASTNKFILPYVECILISKIYETYHESMSFLQTLSYNNHAITERRSTHGHSICKKQETIY